MASRDAAAAEAAELSALRDKAVQREQELAATAAVLAARLHEDGGVRTWARQAAVQAARRGAAEAWKAARRAVTGRRRAGRLPVAAPVIAAVPVCLLAAALTWRRVRGRTARRRRPGRLR
jgi:hypothetical protein